MRAGEDCCLGVVGEDERDGGAGFVGEVRNDTLGVGAVARGEDSYIRHNQSDIRRGW